MRMLGYGRVSTREQGDSKLGLLAQTAKLQTECSRLHWELPEIREEVAGFNDPKPILDGCLADVQGPEYDGLIVARIDRLNRTVFRLASIIDAAKRQGWALVILDPRVDMSTHYGVAMAQMASVFAELERALIAERTSQALQQKVARGEFVGHKISMTAEQVKLCVYLHENQGLGFRASARELDRMGQPTPGGAAVWDHKVVAAAIRRYHQFGIEQASARSETEAA